MQDIDYDALMLEAEKYDYFVHRKCFCCKNEKSDKFWTVNYIDDMYYVHYGKNGTFGRIEIKETESAEACKSFVNKTILEKKTKGYIEAQEQLLEQEFQTHKKECQSVLSSMYFMFHNEINLIYVAAVKEVCEKYCELLARSLRNKEKIMSAVKALVLSLNAIAEENDIIETEERELLYEFINDGARLAGLETEEDITEEWREW